MNMSKQFLKGKHRRSLSTRRSSQELPAANQEARVAQLGQTVRKVARAIHRSAVEHGYDEVSDAAASIKTANKEQLVDHLESLLSKLQTLLKQQSETSASFEGKSLHVSNKSNSPPLPLLILEQDPNKLENLGTNLQRQVPNGIFYASNLDQAKKIIKKNSLSFVVLDHLHSTDPRQLEKALEKEYSKKTQHKLEVIRTSSFEAFEAIDSQELEASLDALEATPDDNYQERAIDQTLIRPPLMVLAPTKILDPVSLLKNPKGNKKAVPGYHSWSSLTSLQIQEAFAAHPIEDLVDPVTKLPNQKAFHLFSEKIIAQSDNASDNVSIALFEFDHFKRFRELHGSKLALETQRRAIKVISLVLRNTDLIAQWQGDQFVVLFPSTPLQQAVNAFKRAKKALQAVPFVTQQGEIFDLSFCAGLTAATTGMSVEHSIDACVRFLHLARNDGEGSIHSDEDNRSRKIKKLLLADDDNLTASLVKHRFQREGFEVIHCRDGASALQVATENQVALCIFSVKLDKVDGFELLRRLRETPSFDSVPIVMLTMMNSEKDIVRGFDLGADDYIVKPFSPVELIARVQRLLKKTASR